MSELIGRIHSFESCGTVDGPGLRFVVFMQGCPLRCLYCHNPDSWNYAEGKEYSVEQIFKEILKYRSYIERSGGGVTVSGGEPLVQSAFVAELFKLCQKANIHTALDTSGAIYPNKTGELYDYCDLVLLDVKSADEAVYKTITSGDLAPVKATLRYLRDKNIKIWIRHVLVPGLTTGEASLRKLGELLKNYDNIELVEILPFHNIGEYKWHELKEKYTLGQTMPPDKAQIEEALHILRQFDLKVRA